MRGFGHCMPPTMQFGYIRLPSRDRLSFPRLRDRAPEQEEPESKMTYKTPIKDIRFALENIAGFGALEETGAFEDLSDDLVEAWSIHLYRS